MRIFAFLIFGALFIQTTYAADPLSKANPPSKTDRIKKILAPLGDKVGFSLRDFKGTELLEVRGRENYPPASVAKMVSSACTMKTLSPQYMFRTSFGYTGTLKNGVVSGDLVVTGAGDPSFVVEDLKEALEKLYVVYGIQEIKGNLIFDASYFGVTSLEIAEGFAGDEGRAFTAPLTAHPFNFNSFALWIVPQDGVARIEVQPKAAMNLKIINKVKITSGGSPEVVVDYRPEQGTAVVSGKLPDSTESKVTYRSVPDPYASLAQVMIRLWKELGGKWAAPKYKVEVKPVSNRRVYTHSSRAISEQLLAINKLSTNFGSELLLLAAGAVSRGLPATAEKTKQVMQECISSMGVGSQQMSLENASGLSRKSSMQPSGLTLFLAQIPKTDFLPEYLSTLSVLGRDGTFRSRMKSFAGRARLKSGSLSGVKTLAGFVFPDGKDPVIFSLFFKCSNCSAANLNETENEILKVLLE